MPKIRIGVKSKPQLTFALQSYVSELREIITSIQDQAKYAGVSPDAYVPEDLATEFQTAKASHGNFLASTT